MVILKQRVVSPLETCAHHLKISDCCC